jgi:hypothetical protein
LNVDTSCESSLKTPTQQQLFNEKETTAWQIPKIALFVDPRNGLDSASGSESDPMRTIQGAVDKAAAVQAAAAAAAAAAESGGEDSGGGGSGPTVVLRGGTHFLKETLRLGPEHSGLTLRAHPADLLPPVVSGGVALEGLEWEEVSVTADEWNTLSADTNLVYGGTIDNVKS